MSTNPPLPSWESVRARLFTGSDIAGLASLSKYATPWKLHQRKLGILPPPDESEAMLWGNLLEGAVLQHPALAPLGFDRWDHLTPMVLESAPCEFVPADKGGQLVPVAVNETLGLGGTPDAVGYLDGVPVLGEVKTVGSRAFDRWEPCDQPPALPELHKYAPTRLLPDSYLVQVQTYLGLLGLADGFVMVLAGGQRLEVHRVTFDADVFAALSRHALDALDALRDGRDPPFDPYEDGADLGPWLLGRELAPAPVTIDDDRLCQVAAEFNAFSKLEKVAKREAAARKAELSHALGTLGIGKAVFPGLGKASFTTRKPQPERVQVVKATEGTRYLRLYADKTADVSAALADAANVCASLSAGAGDEEDGE